VPAAVLARSQAGADAAGDDIDAGVADQVVAYADARIPAAARARRILLQAQATQSRLDVSLVRVRRSFAFFL
jgi:hypothetical protein